MLARRPKLASLLCGAVSALALPPFFWFPLAILGFSGFFLLLSQSPNAKAAAARGFCFGFGHHLVGLYWISNALLTDPEQFAWLVPFAVSLIPAALALYIALLGALFCKIVPQPKRQSIPALFIFCLLWVGLEMARAHLFTGFPWNLMGYGFNLRPETMQLASITGVFGLSFLYVTATTAPALLLQKKPAFVGLCSIALPALLFGFGAWRLANATVEYTDIPIRLVQPNISQFEKWKDDRRQEWFEKHIALSRSAPPGAVVIWPETALPYPLPQDRAAAKALATLLPRQTLLTGAVKFQDDAAGFQVWNSLQVIERGRVIADYDKARLVPFGEFIPLRSLLPFVQKITHGSVDFSAGPGPQSLKVNGLPAFAPLICYEVIYPEYRSTERPEWIVNITNDGWFGDSTGPRQHLEMARMRSVEQGLPLARAANTGISALIDPFGRIINALPIDKEGVIENFLPKPESTFFSHFGEVWLCGFFVLGLILSIRRLTTQNCAN